LLPSGKVTLIAERFADTWTKLALFDFEEYDVSLQVVFLSIAAAQAHAKRPLDHFPATGPHRRRHDASTKHGRTVQHSSRTGSDRLQLCLRMQLGQVELGSRGLVSWWSGRFRA